MIKLIKLIKNFAKLVTAWLKERDCGNCDHSLKYSSRIICDECRMSGNNVNWRPRK